MEECFFCKKEFPLEELTLTPVDTGDIMAYSEFVCENCGD